MGLEVLVLNPPAVAGVPYLREECCTGDAGPKPSLPAQLVQVQSFLQSKGMDSTLIDMQGMGLGYNNYKPEGFDVVISSASVFGSLYHDIESLRIAKRTGAVTALILNDPFEGVEKEVMGDCDFIDYIVRLYEREQTAYQLVRYLERKESVPPSGVIARHESQILDMGKSQCLRDARHLGDSSALLQALPLKNYGWKCTVSGKGCPSRCTFCLYRSTPHRSRRPEDVVKEVEVLSTEPDCIGLLDLEMLVDKTFARRFADELISRRVRASWHTDARVNNCTRDMLMRLRRSGLSYLTLGIESASPAILENIRKDITLESVERAVSNCEESGIVPVACFMFGFPWDTHQTGNQIVGLVKKLRLERAAVSIVRPLAGTPLYDQFKTLGLIGDLGTSQYVSNEHKPMAPTLHLPKEEVGRTAARLNLAIEDYAFERRIRRKFLDVLVHSPYELPTKAVNLLRYHLKRREAIKQFA